MAPLLDEVAARKAANEAWLERAEKIDRVIDAVIAVGLSAALAVLVLIGAAS